MKRQAVMGAGVIVCRVLLWKALVLLPVQTYKPYRHDYLVIHWCDSMPGQVHAHTGTQQLHQERQGSLLSTASELNIPGIKTDLDANPGLAWYPKPISLLLSSNTTTATTITATLTVLTTPTMAATTSYACHSVDRCLQGQVTGN